MKPLSFLQKNRVDLSSICISEVRSYRVAPVFLAHPVYDKLNLIQRKVTDFENNINMEIDGIELVIKNTEKQNDREMDRKVAKIGPTKNS